MAADGATSSPLSRLRDRLTARRLAVAGVLWTAAVAALTAESPVGGVGSWLDGSWQVGLLLSHRFGLPLGSRLLFPYGPYGFLTVTIPFFAPQWMLGLAVGLALHVALVGLVCVLLVRRRAGPVVWSIVTVAVLIGLPAFAAPDTEGQLVAALLAFFAVTADSARARLVAAALCGAVLALLLLMKATALPLALGVVVLGGGALLLRRRGRSVVVLVAGMAVTGAVLWFAAGLGIGDITRYLHAAFDLGSGYSAAMYFMGLTVPLVLGSVFLGALAVLAVGLMLRRRPLDGLWVLLACAALFPVYKDSFVRDGPVRDDIFFGVAGLVAALSLAVVAPRARAWASRRQALPAAVLIACTALGMGWRSTDLSGLTGAGNRLAAYRTVLSALFSGGVRRSLESVPLSDARSYYQGIISALPAAARASTIDVMPWDVGMFYVQAGLRWDPRPVLQSYTAYTPWLDQQDADFLLGPRAPDYIVYSYLTIDDRYAAFDEPATFRALLDRYRVVTTLGSSAVLLQRVFAGAEPQSPAGTTCTRLGSAITVPQSSGVRTYARVEVSRSLVGSALNLVAKSPGLRVVLTTAAGTFNGRFIDAVAPDGLYVSRYLATTADLPAAITGIGGVPITSLAVIGNGGGWSAGYCVAFTTTPLSGGQRP